MSARRMMIGLGAAGALLATGMTDATAGAAESAETGDGHPAVTATTATLYISDAGSGYYYVVVDGQSPAANATVGVRVKGDDEWFDDTLFSFGGGYSHTDPWGNFNVSTRVHGSKLNEDWGTDEVYAIVDVSGAGSVRTNTIRRSF